MRDFITPKTFPLGEDGKFQSEPAEAAYSEMVCNYYGGILRDQFRTVLQAYVCDEDESKRKYEEWAKRRNWEHDV